MVRKCKRSIRRIVTVSQKNFDNEKIQVRLQINPHQHHCIYKSLLKIVNVSIR